MVRSTFACLGLGLLVILGSCSGSSSVGTTFLRVLHNSPDAPAFDVYITGRSAPLVAGISYGQSTGFLELTPESVTFELRAAGSSSTSTPLFVSQPIALPDGARSTILATGLFNVGTDFRVVAGRDSLAASAAGSFRARFYHSAPGAGTIGIDINDDGSIEFPGIAEHSATAASGEDLPANVSLLIGIVDDATSNRLTGFTLPPIPEGAEVIIVASGLIDSRPDGPDGFLLRAAINNGSFASIPQDPFVYIVHASPDAPAIDVLLNGFTVVAGSTFGGLAGPLQVSPGAYSFDVVPSAGGASLAQPSTPPLVAGETYALIATGFVNPPAGNTEAFEMVVTEDDLSVDSANQRVQALHVSPDAPAIDVGVVSGGAIMQPALFENLAYPSVSLPAGGLPIPPMSGLVLGVAPTGNATPSATFTINTVADLRTLVLAAGAFNPRVGTDEPLQLLVIDTNSFPWQIASVPANP